MTNDQTIHTVAGPSQFPTTRWTLVVAAGDPHRKEARSALVALCENYWYPLYAYLRRRGYTADQAQDLTHSPSFWSATGRRCFLSGIVAHGARPVPQGDRRVWRFA